MTTPRPGRDGSPHGGYGDHDAQDAPPPPEGGGCPPAHGQAYPDAAPAADFLGAPFQGGSYGDGFEAAGFDAASYLAGPEPTGYEAGGYADAARFETGAYGDADGFTAPAEHLADPLHDPLPGHGAQPHQVWPTEPYHHDHRPTPHDPGPGGYPTAPAPPTDPYPAPHEALAGPYPGQDHPPVAPTAAAYGEHPGDWYRPEPPSGRPDQQQPSQARAPHTAPAPREPEGAPHPGRPDQQQEPPYGGHGRPVHPHRHDPQEQPELDRTQPLPQVRRRASHRRPSEAESTGRGAPEQGEEPLPRPRTGGTRRAGTGSRRAAGGGRRGRPAAESPAAAGPGRARAPRGGSRDDRRAPRPSGTSGSSGTGTAASSAESGATGPAGAAEAAGAGAAAGHTTGGAAAAGGRAARRRAAKQRSGGGGGRRRAGGARRGGDARQQEARPGGRGGHRARGQRAGHATESEGTDGTGDEPTAPLSRVAARRARRAARPTTGVVVSGVIGEIFISIGVLMLLFVTYQLWWTNVRAHQQADGTAHSLQDDWAKGKGRPGVFAPGQGFAILHIPKLDVVAPIAEGISKQKVLDRGMIGHYGGPHTIQTAMPDAKTGNFGLAGHRNTHGEPFRYINHLVKGDKLVVETQDTYYVYEVASNLPQTTPDNTDVLGPVPPGSGFTKPGRYITLTTCTPEFTSKYRLIVWGSMVEERPRSKGKPKVLVN